MSERQGRDERLERMYEAFNVRDVDAALVYLTDDVDWPAAWEGGRVRGKNAVRDYWIRQWAEIHPTVLPTAFSALDEHRVAVEVRQIVQTLEGTPLQDRRIIHVYAFNADGMITRMDVETPG